ncbi:carbon-nitrogen hydrolase family protein [Nakamurella sp. PAMC28650]|jgi:predicted amidohydrolase|uniref:carbon-nitrogen hydrolase family protein n=1 Tax=Nakamurella sp. PAMC28650 TaxID=2762325 RepID=UPI00164E9F5A|nr:carbon-nitrogen hydrolase family protein [Nakamurella sp. PAMC28650]QNK79650.1 carbon-nitrogen hydrolase family protein [Nakamurella sp. PAMC28650]
MSGAREPLRIAAVQCLSHPGDIAGTVAEHARQIDEAAELGADVVLFPELSLTGYEPDLIDLHGLRITPDSAVLQPISLICQRRRVHALVGAPTASGSLPQIGVLHIDPRGAVRQIYAKQHLAVGEIGIFSAGTSPGRLTVNGWKLAMAVCADAAMESHAAAASESGADAYLVGALFVIGREKQIDVQMRQAARKGMWVVLAQYSGGTGGGPACGLSGAWRPDGREVTRLGAGPGIALVDLT